MRKHELEEAGAASVMGEDGDSTSTPTAIVSSAAGAVANTTQQNMPIMHMTGQVNIFFRY